MVWLVPQQALQSIDGKTQVEPARDRVDIQVCQDRQRTARPPKEDQPLETLEAREDERADRPHRSRGRTLHPLTSEAEKKQDEGQPERHRVHEQQLLHRDVPGHLAILSRRQQVRKPVVAQG
jgi:hypothetical protein